MRAALALIVTLAACSSSGGETRSDDTPGDDGSGSGDDTSNTQCIDIDCDGVCNAVDICPGADDAVDSDADTIPDGCDDCPGIDDRIDTNANSIPDCAEVTTRAIDIKVVGGNFWRGWYNAAQGHTAGNDNTLTGDSIGGVYNSYFVFPLAGITASSIQSVTLELELELYSGAATETYSIWDVTTPPADVENGADAATVVADLQSGNEYGTSTVDAGQVGQVISTPLTGTIAADVKAHLGQDFAVGVHLDTASGTFIRFSAGGAEQPRHHRLVITYVP